MLLAAGLGTRLGALTRTLPKALVPVGGIPMLERVARNLIAVGVDHLIINTHHHAERIVEFVREHRDFGVRVDFSPEPDAPLETGGGLLKAAPLFAGREPFFLHNVDVLTDLPLGEMYRAHLETAPLATLAVMQRSSDRALLFDRGGLFGRVDDGKALRLEARPPSGEVQRLGFSGVHVVSPSIFPLITERGTFSLLDPYLRLAAAGHRILPFEAGEFSWIDIGKPDQLETANLQVGRTLLAKDP